MESPAATHPSADALRAFALGKLEDTMASVVMSHLDGCPDCCRGVAALSGDDFLARFRKVHWRTATPAPAKSPADAARAPRPTASQILIPDLPPELAQNAQYEIRRELGRGGMGVVYLARNKLMDRQEVLKVINKTLLDSPGAVERFLREIRSAAKLKHPNVVAAYSAVQQGDLLAFAMEYIEGEDLAKVVKAKGPLPVAHACYYAQQAALGLQHAFEKGMVHRDIKPQNLILSRDGKRHIVKVLDFGLAKAKREKNEDTGLTGEGAMLGTPDYVAPEQTVDAANADIRADVYSLGCTLYFLLTGAPPFKGRSLFEVLQAHHSTEAKPLHVARPELPEELSAVVGKMMAKAPALRYQTPEEVVRALVGFIKPGAKGASPKPSPDLSDRESESKAERSVAPVAESVRREAARTHVPPAAGMETLSEGSGTSAKPRKSGVTGKRLPPAGGPKTGKKWLIGVGVVAGVLLIGLVGLLAVGLLKVKTPNGTIVLTNVPGDAEVKIEGEIVTITRNGETVTVTAVSEGPHRLKVVQGGQEIWSSDVTVKLGGDPLRLTVDPPKRLMVDPPNSLTGDYDLTGGRRFVHFGPNGLRVVLRGNDATQKVFFARVYDLASKIALSPPIYHDRFVQFAWLSPDGTRVVTGSGDLTAGAGRVWDAQTGQPITPPLQHDCALYHASFSPDGKRGVTACGKGKARVWDSQTGQPLTPLLTHDLGKVMSFATFSPDGKRVVTACMTGRVWDAQTGQPITPPLQHEEGLEGVFGTSFSPDGTRVVTVGRDSTARLWDAQTGQLIPPPLMHDQAFVWHAAFSRDGKRVVTVSTEPVRKTNGDNKMARVWDAKTGQAITPPLRHDMGVIHASFSPDGARVVTASRDETARVWNALTGQPLTQPLKHNGFVQCATFSPDGKWVVTFSANNTAQLWDAETGQELKKVTISLTK